MRFQTFAPRPLSAPPDPQRLTDGQVLVNDLLPPAAGLRTRLVQEADGGATWLVREAAFSNESACHRLQREAQQAAACPVATGVLPQSPLWSADRMLLVHRASPGLTTFKRLGHSGVSVPTFVALCLGAVDAVQALHAAGQLHGDLRTEYFVVDDQQQVSLVAAIGGSGDLQALTDKGALPFQAPELDGGSAGRPTVATELYALGVCLFELLTGRMPLSAQTPAEWAHAHAAAAPVQASRLRQDVPQAVSAVLEMLLRKDPAARYRDAGALRDDLQDLSEALRASDRLEGFDARRSRQRLARRASTLFGRQQQQDALAAALHRVTSTSDSEIVLIEGGAGGGKSAIAHWLLQGAKAAGAMIAVGKCDQQQLEIPFSPVSQILESLTSQLLGAEQQQLEAVRARWLSFLHGQGQAVVELVPTIAHVLGPSPGLANVAAAQARARMEHALLQSLRAFASPDQPLVLLMDDLQWADEATAGLLEAFVQQPPPGVLLLCAYRDGGAEGARARALIGRIVRARHASRAKAVAVTELSVPPLGEGEMAQMLQEVLGPGGTADLEGLARAVQARTGGNPYFALQWVKSLMDDEVLVFDRHSATWRCDLAALHRADYSDTVLDLMVSRLARLPAQTMEVAQHLASVGIACEAGLLARLAGLTPEALEAVLQPAVDAGLIMQRGRSIAFEHDRVLESAYSFIDPGQAPPRHARVADAMLAHWQADRGHHAFEICNQIERSTGHEPSPAQRDAFVSILLQAGLRAKQASAWTQASNFIDRALGLVEERLWTEQPEVAFGVHALHCDILLAAAQLEQAELQIRHLLSRDLEALQKANVHRLQAVLFTIHSDYESAIDAALRGLHLLDVPLYRHPSDEDMRATYLATLALIGGSDGIAALGTLPTTDDPRMRAVMSLLATLLASAFISDGISFQHLAKMVELTALHGATPESPHGLAWFGVFCSIHYEAYADALAFGQAALALIERHGYEAERISTLVALDQSSAWTRPMDVALSHVQQAVRLGLASGDAAMACYAYNHIVSDLLIMGWPLSLVQEELHKGIALTRTMKYRDIELLLLSQQQYVDTVTAVQPDIQTLRDGTRLRIEEARSLPTQFWTWLYGGMGLFQLGSYDEAVAHLREAERLAWSARGHVNIMDAHLYLCLSLARGSEVAQNPAAIIRTLQDRLTLWTKLAQTNPHSFQNKRQLLGAELLRLQGRPLEAIAGFEQSARTAMASGFLHEQALALQYAGELCLAHGLRQPGLTYLRAARERYRAWGASGCVARTAVVLAAADGSDAADDSQALDVRRDPGQAAWELGVSAGHALSGEAVIGPLVQTLMTHLMMHAGATYGALLLQEGEQFEVVASARVVDGQVQVLQCPAMPDEQAIPPSMLNSVARTRQSLVLNDGATMPFPATAEAPNGRLRSALCMPLLRGDVLDGVIYFENGLAAGVFHEQRTARVALMLPQVAIALKSARLYEQLIRESDRRLQAELGLRTAQAELVRASHMTVLANLAASIAHEVNQPLASIVTHADASLRWLNRPVPNIEEVTAGLAGIRNDGLRAAEVIRAVKALARQAPSRYEPLVVDDVLRDVVGLLSADLADRQIRVVMKVGAAHPVAADRAQLQQVALNLVTNAMDAMAEVPVPQRELRISSGTNDQQVTVLVEDGGSGIDAALMEKIFDPFFTTKAEGMGMGLAICRSIVQAHGGQLFAAPRASGGTVMTWQMPVDGSTLKGPNHREEK
jgi:predicted ATPase/signal transduction histidine kinase